MAFLLKFHWILFLAVQFTRNQHWFIWLGTEQETNHYLNQDWGEFWIYESKYLPLNTWRNNNVVITSKRRHFDVITSKWRRFDVITTSLLRNVSTGLWCVKVRPRTFFRVWVPNYYSGTSTGWWVQIPNHNIFCKQFFAFYSQWKENA